MSVGPADDPILKRFRAALDELYGDRIERVVLFGSHARWVHTTNPITTLRCFSRNSRIAGRKSTASLRSLPTSSIRTRLSFRPCRSARARIGIAYR